MQNGNEDMSWLPPPPGQTTDPWLNFFQKLGLFRYLKPETEPWKDVIERTAVRIPDAPNPDEPDAPVAETIILPRSSWSPSGVEIQERAALGWTVKVSRELVNGKDTLVARCEPPVPKKKKQTQAAA